MTLAALLTAGARFAPQGRDGLSNQLPIALLSLSSLGADEARLGEFAAGHAVRLAPAPAPQVWPAGDPWRGRFGEPEAWPAYRALFAEWIDAEDAASVLSQALPALMPGCGGAEFNGLVRLACAIRSRHLGELVDALAYWACSYLALAALADTSGRITDPERLMRRLQAGRSRQPLMSQRMLHAARSPALRSEFAALSIDASSLERLSRLSAKAYAGTGNPTALQLITACHAMRVVQGFIDEPLPALRWFWQAWATAVVAAGLKRLPPMPAQDWDRIVAAALASDDEDLIKLVDSCRGEELAYGGDDWRRAASRPSISNRTMP